MNALKLLRVKVVFSIVLVQMVILATILATLNLSLRGMEFKKSRDFIQYLEENGGHIISHKNKLVEKESTAITTLEQEIQEFKSISQQDKFYNLMDRISFQLLSNTPEIRNYFSVNVSYAGAINEIIYDFPLNYTKDEISSLLKIVLKRNRMKGMVNGVIYSISPTKYGNYLICFLNIKSEIATLNQLFWYSLLIYIGSLVISFLFSIGIAKIITKSTDEAFEKQKRFIADAGHELKTPIAVISANIDVLEPTLKDNKFFQYIKAENKRMGELVKDLLYLAKNDANKNEVNFYDFDFSKAMENAILPFEVIAFESKMKLSINIQKDIQVYGNEKELKQLAIILVDNAIKNSEEGAEITVTAAAEYQKVLFKVRNTGAGIKKEDIEKIFNRFYRADTSRARKTGGYGLGLSIAKSIATEHGGTISVTSEIDKYAEFQLTLPKKAKK